MTPMTVAKLTLALIAAILFGIGVRNDTPALRIAAIAFLAVAVLIRFLDRNRSSK
ncbi:MAG TPA: hypothetical protein VFT21_09980 [Gemmatimonadaceae bacterium]|jgi:hypothetical protein|nr:hypothetical protein [Gemmatimonadaceae bacterium]